MLPRSLSPVLLTLSGLCSSTRCPLCISVPWETPQTPGSVGDTLVSCVHTWVHYLGFLTFPPLISLWFLSELLLSRCPRPWPHPHTSLITSRPLLGRVEGFLLPRPVSWEPRFHHILNSFYLWLVVKLCDQSQRYRSPHIKGEALEFSKPFYLLTKPGFQDYCFAKEAKQNKTSNLIVKAEP